MADSQPWLANKGWHGNQISSGSKTAHWVLGGFALIWNLVTLPMFWQLPSLIKRIPDEPLLALVFLFPLLGLGLLWTSWLFWQRWRKFGPTPLRLDPFPGAIGGQVGGLVDIAIPYHPQQSFAVTLSCLRSSVSGSGKNRSRNENIKWQNAGVCHSEASDIGTRLRFRFNVPAGLPESDLSKAGSYHLWRVAITSELDGPDFDRRFEIPVFPTGASSAIAEATETYAATMDHAADGVETIADITPIPGGVEAYFPPLQRPAQGIICTIFGVVFVAVGIGVAGVGDASKMIPLAFIPAGLAIMIYGIYYLGKSLRVGITQGRVRQRRFFCGYPITTRELAGGNIVGFEIEQGATMTSGDKTTVFYQVVAKGKTGKGFVVAERLASRAEAVLLQDTYTTYLGMGQG
jgi:hypothetical protein